MTNWNHMPSPEAWHRPKFDAECPIMLATGTKAIALLTTEEAIALVSDLTAAIAEAIEFKAQTVHANSQPSFERGCISPEPTEPTESVPPG